MSIDSGLDLEHTYATELEGMYVPFEPPGFPKPSLLLLNRRLTTALGLNADWLEANGAAVLSGSSVVPGSHPLAQAYAGHQFGQFNPQLGDGRALLLGEVVDPEGRRFDLQLKGSGQTPFSRGGRWSRRRSTPCCASIFVSEAMHALGVPTTRSLAVVTTGEIIERRGSAPGAVLTRIAASHLRDRNIGVLRCAAADGQAAAAR